MKNVYVYLSRDNYTYEHIDYMNGLFSCLEAVGESRVISENIRQDLDSFEYQIEVTEWAERFLKHMSLCDMLHCADGPIPAEV